MTVSWLGLGWFRDGAQGAFTPFLQCRWYGDTGNITCYSNHTTTETLSLPWVAGEDEITVNGSFPRRSFTYHSGDWQLVGFEGPRGLNRSTSAGQREARLPVFLLPPVSHTLFSEVFHGGYISPLLRLTSIRGVYGPLLAVPART